MIKLIIEVANEDPQGIAVEVSCKIIYYR